MNTPSKKWQLFKIVESHILQSNGYIFGGYPRDKIIHDHFAKQFYQNNGTTDKYEDSTFNPESYKGRITLPQDFDIVMASGDIEILINCMKDNGLYVSRVDDKIGYKKIKDGFSYSKLKISPYIHRIILETMNTQPTSVQVDIIHKNDFDWPRDCDFSTFDFRCNSLVITPSGIYDMITMKDFRNTIKNEIIQDIIQEILLFEAHVPIIESINNVDTYRINKMYQKGFEIATKDICIKQSTTKEDICIVCHDVFNEEAVLTPGCCSVKFHLRCYKTLIEHDAIHWSNCIMCRQPRKKSINIRKLQDIII